MSARALLGIATLAAVVVAVAAPRRADAGPPARSVPTSRPAPADAPVPGTGDAPAPLPGFDGPYHGKPNGLAYGGNIELRFAEDRVRGVSNPEWFSVGSVGGFFVAQIHPRVRFAWEGAWDRGADDFSMESAYLDFQLRGPTHMHAGIFLAPLGITNLRHEAPLDEFEEHSFVATQIIGVPNAELGVGIYGSRRTGRGATMTYEIDVVTGYNDGLVMDSPGGTRIASGRSNYGDNNGAPALAARIAYLPSPTTEIGLAAQSGKYNETEVGGVTVDQSRYVHVVVADGVTMLAGFRVLGEAAVAMIDVPPGLGTLFAERQWGASIQADRVMLRPFVRSWRTSSLTAAIRADAVDLDRAVLGDSRSRLSMSLNLRPRAASVLRLGWYYEVERDRFNNPKPMAGVTVGVGSYF